MNAELPIFEPLLTCPFVTQHGGVGVYEDLIGKDRVDALKREAFSNYRFAENQQADMPDAEEGRGGTPRRSLLSGPGGPAQDSLYSCQRISRLLSSLVGARLVPSGNRGSFSYYCRPGDYLDLHRYIVGCDVTV